MSSNPRIRPDLAWRQGTPITWQEFKKFDDGSVLALDGDNGGTYTLTGLVSVGGAGMAFDALTAFTGSAAFTTPLGSGVRLICGDSDYPLLNASHAGQSRTLVTQIGELVTLSGGSARWDADNTYLALRACLGIGASTLQWGSGAGTSWTATHGYALGNKVQPSPGNSFAYMCVVAGMSAGGAPTWGTVPGGLTAESGGPTWVNLGLVTSAKGVVPLRVHHGTMFVSVAFDFAVYQTHANVPSQLPTFRVYALDKLTGSVVPLKTTVAGGGFISASAASGSAWYASGHVQRLTYYLDAGVMVDTTRFAYFAELHDEGGADAWTGNYYFDLVASFTNLADLRPG